MKNPEKEALKSSNFKRIAKFRVNKVLKGFKVLTNLTSSNYASTPEERDEIISALRKGLEEIEVVFQGEKVNKESFEFKPSFVE